MRFSGTSILTVITLTFIVATPATSGRAAPAKSVPKEERLATTGKVLSSTSPAQALRGRPERSETPGGSVSCPGGRVERIVDCPEVVCPCQRGRNIVLARAHDPKTGCCNASSCDQICSQRTRCPRF